VQRFTPQLIDAAARAATMPATAGMLTKHTSELPGLENLYRAVTQFGQVIDVMAVRQA
jgi:hypothetical protein